MSTNTQRNEQKEPAPSAVRRHIPTNVYKTVPPSQRSLASEEIGMLAYLAALCFSDSLFPYFAFPQGIGWMVNTKMFSRRGEKKNLGLDTDTFYMPVDLLYFGSQWKNNTYPTM